MASDTLPHPAETAATAPAVSGFDCVLRAWHAHEAELLGFLAQQLHDHPQAEDLLQEVFLKSMRLGRGFCSLDNPRAWLYRVARNTLIDHLRANKPLCELPDDLPAPVHERAAVDALDLCLLRNIERLGLEDRSILQACDINGVTVRVFAQTQALGLPAAKSRLLRARQRLRQLLVDHCQVQFDERGQVCCHVASGTL